MDPMCQFEYGVLYNGSILGEMSLFFDEPNQFCYAYNLYQTGLPIQCLAVDSQEFMRICRKYPLTFEKLLHQAYRRKKVFEKYRTICLLTLMKGVINFNGLFHKIFTDKSNEELSTISQLYFVRRNIYQSLYHLFQIHSLQQRKQYNKLNLSAEKS